MRRRRNLDKAEWLRPSEVFEIYGIPKSALSQLCLHKDPERRLPSVKVPGRSGTRGLRFVNKAVIDAYFMKHTQ